MYYLPGFFGPAWFGTDAMDQGNIPLSNLGGGNRQGVLNIFFAGDMVCAMFLSSAASPCHSLGSLLSRKGDEHTGKTKIMLRVMLLQERWPTLAAG